MPTPQISIVPSASVARRFERLCRARGLSCRVDETAADGGPATELRVTATAGDGEALSIRGLEADAWRDRGGLEGLARLVGVWLEAAPREPRILPYRRPASRSGAGAAPRTSQPPRAAGR